MPSTKPRRSDHIELRATPQEKFILARAAAIEHLDLTSLVMRVALPAAHEIIERSEHIVLSERDTLFVMELLENPPLPNDRLNAAAQAWTENFRKTYE